MRNWTQLAISLGVGLCLVSAIGCNLELSRNAAANASGAGAHDSHFATELTPANFEAEIIVGAPVALVDCWAPWCGPCVKLGPTIEELALEYEGKALIGKLNVDEAADLAREYEISGIPALIFFKDGVEVDRLVGLVTKQEISEKLDRLLAL